MVLKTKDMTVDIDRVSFVHESNRMVVVDGQGINISTDADFYAVKKAFEWQNKAVMYDENMKKIKRGE